MKRIFLFLDKLEESVTVALFALMTIDVLIAVFLRYVVKIPFPYSEEIARYMVIWATLIGFSICARKKAHLGIDMLVEKLPPKASKAVALLVQFLSLATYVFLTYASVKFVTFSFSIKQMTPALQIPYWVVYLALPIGFGLSSLRTVQIIWNDNFSKEKDESRYEEVNIL